MGDGKKLILSWDPKDAYMSYTPSVGFLWPNNIALAYGKSFADIAWSKDPLTVLKTTLDPTHFICQQCNKPIDKLIVTDDFATNQSIIKFYCHNEIISVCIASEVFEQESSYGNPETFILKMSGSLFSNPKLVNRTMELIYDLEINPVLSALIYKELQIISANSLECARLIVQRAKSASPAVSSILNSLKFLHDITK